MNKIFASLLALVGMSGATQAAPPTQMLDPNNILFSTPTLSDDLAAMEPAKHKPTAKDLVFHEDEWCQLEFFPKSQLPEVQRILKEYKPFEQANRTKSGWRNVYVRKINRVAVIQGPQALQKLEAILGIEGQSAPMLFSSSEISGQIKNGFTLPAGAGITLYGYTSLQGIPVLGAYVGENPDEIKLTKAFTALNKNSGAILVDWRAQQVLTGVEASGQISVWRP